MVFKIAFCLEWDLDSCEYFWICLKLFHDLLFQWKSKNCVQKHQGVSFPESKLLFSDIIVPEAAALLFCPSFVSLGLICFHCHFIGLIAAGHVIFLLFLHETIFSIMISWTQVSRRMWFATNNYSRLKWLMAKELLDSEGEGGAKWSSDEVAAKKTEIYLKHCEFPTKCSFIWLFQVY